MKLLPSKRAHLFVLERSRVYCRDGRVEYVTDEGRDPLGFNIPVANTMFLLLGPGCSITQEAVRLLRQEGVCIGFCGSGGTPLLSAQDPYPDMLLPADEYREPAFLQRWISGWQSESIRLAIAKSLMRRRVEYILDCWPAIDLDGPMPMAPERDLEKALKAAENANSTAELLGIEGGLTKLLYKSAAITCGFSDFKRQQRTGQGPVGEPNRFLDHGNYLAYGLASVVLWTLGLPASLSVLHGKTRRGGLVFDVADVIKDACVLPTAFNVAARMRSGDLDKSDTEFRSTCLNVFRDRRAMDVMFEAITDSLSESAP
ncbi:MAG: type I-F CRISPR-associated endonuclease Cas1f [Alphaproteobacteria bacterium]